MEKIWFLSYTKTVYDFVGNVKGTTNHHIVGLTKEDLYNYIIEHFVNVHNMKLIEDKSEEKEFYWSDGGFAYKGIIEYEGESKPYMVIDFICDTETLVKGNDKITIEQYNEALKVVQAYEKQVEQEKAIEKAKLYEGCSVDDILSRTLPHPMYRNDVLVHYFWVTKEKEIPERNYDGAITQDKRYTDWFEIEGGRKVYKTYDAAYSDLIKSFKRKQYIQ